MFDAIDGIAAEYRLTHIFTWPLQSMAQRFENMGYRTLTRRERGTRDYRLLIQAVWSIYGRDTSTSNHILGPQFDEFNFVLYDTQQ